MGHHDDKRPDERVVEYIYGELSSADAARFEAEMEGNPALAAEVRDLQAVANLAASTIDPIPEPPEAAVAEALAAARARCDQLQGAEQTPWERVAAWLLTPQLAGALTLVLVISVGVYTLQTGVFDRDAGEAPSVKHEMAPVGPVAEAEEARKVAPTAAPTTPKQEQAAGYAAGWDDAPEEPLKEQAASVPQPPVPEPVEVPAAETAAPDAPPSAAADAVTGQEEPRDEDRWQNRGEGADRLRNTERGLRSLVDLATPTDLEAAPGLEDPEEAPAKRIDVDARRGAAAGEVRAEVSGGAGNFVEKSARKPTESLAGKAAGLRSHKTRAKKNTKKGISRKKKAADDLAWKKLDQSGSEGRRDDTRKLDTTAVDKIAEVREETKTETKTDAPARVEGKKDAGMKMVREEPVAGPAPKVTRSVLDGIIVPPSPAPERMSEREEAPVVTMDLAKKSVAIGGTGDGDDGFLGAGSSGGDAGGTFSSTTGLDEDGAANAEPSYMIRPDAAEAPGIAITQGERRKESAKKRPAAKSAAVVASVQAEVADDAVAPNVGMESERAESDEGGEIALDTGVTEEEAPGDMTTELAKEKSPAPPKDDQAICAALAKAIEEAEEAEDWALAEQLTQQMVARGCVAGADRNAAEEQGAMFRQKAFEADLVDPTEQAPMVDKAAEPAGAIEPAEKK